MGHAVGYKRKKRAELEKKLGNRMTGKTKSGYATTSWGNPPTPTENLRHHKKIGKTRKSRKSRLEGKRAQRSNEGQ